MTQLASYTDDVCSMTIGNVTLLMQQQMQIMDDALALMLQAEPDPPAAPRSHKGDVVTDQPPVNPKHWTPRDEIAMRVLPAIFGTTSPPFVDEGGLTNELTTFAHFAECAYDMADEMLAARLKPAT